MTGKNFSFDRYFAMSSISDAMWALPNELATPVLSLKGFAQLMMHQLEEEDQLHARQLVQGCEAIIRYLSEILVPSLRAITHTGHTERQSLSPGIRGAQVLQQHSETLALMGSALQSHIEAVHPIADQRLGESAKTINLATNQLLHRFLAITSAIANVLVPRLQQESEQN